MRAKIATIRADVLEKWQKNRVKKWKMRLVGIESNGLRAAKELNIHQGKLSDIMNGKISPTPSFFDSFELWLSMKEKDKKSALALK